jgi:peptidoglycan hydrolase-like protein with peptidoglycan-binding domain
MVGIMNLSNFKDKNEIGFDDIAIIRLTERTVQLREVQRRLQEEGFYPGPIDGVMGPGTRTALSQYQAKHGLPKTGALDDATRKALGAL